MLSYDPATGHFVWIAKLSIRAPIGRRAGTLAALGDGQRIPRARQRWPRGERPMGKVGYGSGDGYGSGYGEE